MSRERPQKWTIIMLCSFGFFISLNVSVPYLSSYLLGPLKNLTMEELNNQVYPVWSYSYTIFLIPIFLLTDYLRYKPVINLQGAAYVGCYCLLVFAAGVPLMKLMQVTYGLATACDIGYYSYIYSVVPEDHYQVATSYVRTSTQLGLFIGSVISQILVSVAHIDYFYLNIISLVTVSIALVISFFLPFPKRSMYFYKKNVNPDGTKIEGDETPSGGENELSVRTNTESETSSVNSLLGKWKLVLWQLWIDLKHCYSTPSLLRWSIWWALSMCGWILVVNYIQNLWEKKRPSEDHAYNLYNGGVEAVGQILGAGAALAVGYMKIDWKVWGELLLGFGSVIKCGLLILMYATTNIWICYAAYVLFIGLYNFVITISQYQIAVGLSTERFALVFGMNTFFAVVLNSILTLIVVDKVGLGLDVTTQFVVYSGYFGVVAVAYLTHAFYYICKCRFMCRFMNAAELVEVVEDAVQEDLL